MNTITSFDEALEASSELGNPQLLLGNGFSRSLFDEIFSYPSLLEKAEFPETSHLGNVFTKLDTTDFEYAMRRLEETRDLLSIYLSPEGLEALLAPLKSEEEVLRNTLVSTIAKNHPNIPDKITLRQYKSCRRFLKHFVKKEKSHVFTLNYDLLLYWTLVRSPPMGKDGFWRSDNDDPDSPLLWGPNRKQNVHYLHGALHLFETQADVEKLTSANMGERILDQVTREIASSRFPLFITEGKSKHKLRKIRDSAYLEHSYRRFREVVREKDSVLFIFGHSLSDQDDHILKQIVKGSFQHLFVSVRKGFEEDAGRIVSQARKLAGRRKGTSLELHFYSAESANVWSQP